MKRLHKINILGLEPGAKELQPASSYVILAPLDRYLIDFSLAAIDESSVNNIFIVSAQIESFFESTYAEKLNLQYTKNRVFPFSLSQQNHSDFVQQAKKVINELKAYPEINDSLILIHFSTLVFKEATNSAFKALLDDYIKFTQQTQASLLFLVSGPDAANYQVLLRKMNKLLGGSVFIDNTSAVMSVNYDFWHYSDGVLSDTQYQILPNNNQLVVQSQNHKDVNEQRLFDEDDVWLVKSAVPPGTKLPVFYKTVDENQQLFDMSHKLRAATLVFSVTRYTDLTALATECFKLRKSSGRWLKLVIQNVDGIIRHQDECLFLTLGVNLILYTFSEPSRLLSQIQSIQGFQFSRLLPPSVEHVLQYTENIHSKGYLSFEKFTRQVEIHSNSAVNLGVSGVLVKLELLPRIDPIHILNLFHIKREGDMFCIIANTVYLYLHACRENDVSNAIEHLFKLKTNDFFSKQTLISDHFYIQQECKQLRQRFSADAVIDYSGQLTNSVKDPFLEENVTDGQTKKVNDVFLGIERDIAVPITMRLNK